MESIVIKIAGQPPSKKSGQQIKSVKGKLKIFPNPKYQEWKKTAAEQLKIWKVDYYKKMQREWLTIRKPIRVRMQCECLRFGYRQIDLLNILQSVADELEANGIIENDTQIVDTDNSRIYYFNTIEEAGVVIYLAWDRQDIFCYDDCSQMFKSRHLVKCRRHLGLMETTRERDKFYRLANCKTWSPVTTRWPVGFE